jgi:hypothetical protein
MYDPTYPPANAEIESAPMRNQFNALKALIDAIQTLTAAQVDGVTTLPPGSPAAASVTVTGNTLHFTFQIPTGATGAPGAPGTPGAPGEVSQQELTSAILGTALNPGSVSPLGTAFNDPVSASDLNTVASKLDELIGALKRNP